MPERIRPVLNAMRVRHWSKNLLVFLPLITGHEITDLGLIWLGAVALMELAREHTCSTGRVPAGDHAAGGGPAC